MTIISAARSDAFAARHFLRPTSFETHHRARALIVGVAVTFTMTQREVLCGISTVAPHEEGVFAGTFGAIVIAACAGTRATDNILRARTMEAQESILAFIITIAVPFAQPQRKDLGR